MPKRSASEQIEYYSGKIKKLQDRKTAKRRRVIVYSSSSDSNENPDNGAHQVEECNEANEKTTPASPVHTPTDPDNDIVLSTAPQDVTPEPAPELDPELLEALGDASDEIPVFGPDIHGKLAQLWLPILKKGITKETKEKLLKEYSVPNNCKLLKAPTLNAEISAAIPETVRARDKKIQVKQDQLGLGIAAINKAMTLLLTGDDKIQAIKILSDGCRILTDIHYVESQLRTKLITPGLEKSFLTLIQDQDRDETLFGNKLPEKIKASKAIEKQGLQIKKAPNPKPPANTSSSAGRFHHQGNWSGPPRYPSSRRGGRTSTYKTPAQQQYRRAQSTTSAQSSRPSANTSYNKPAPTKQ